MMKGNDMTAAEVLRLIAKVNFRKMNDLDYESFGAVESDEGLIGYNLVIDDNEVQYTIIIDGNLICLIDADGDEAQYILGDNVFA
jgi:hypothetical protein